MSRKASDVLWDVGCSFDWISPLLQWLGDARGLVTVEGTKAEIQQLKRHRIPIYNPMAIIGTDGGYLWQIRKQDQKRAMKILGGKS